MTAPRTPSRPASRQALLGLAAAGVLALLVAGGVALLGGDPGTQDGPQAAPRSTGPVAVPPSSPPPASSAAPAAAPSTAPAGPPSASPTRPLAPPPAGDLLLTTRDADRAEPGDWRREGQDVEGALLDPCEGGTAYPRDADVMDSAATVLVAEREAGGTTAVQTVARYTSRAAAQDAAAGYVRAVQGCPEEPRDSPEGGTVSHAVVGRATVGGVATTYVRRASRCPACVRQATLPRRAADRRRRRRAAGDLRRGRRPRPPHRRTVRPRGGGEAVLTRHEARPPGGTGPRRRAGATGTS